MSEIRAFLQPIRRLHDSIREAVVSACEETDLTTMSRVALEEEGDTIYAIDRISEELLIRFFETQIAPQAPLILIAEGLSGGKVVLPKGMAENEAKWRVIVDPIDGTRGLMYQKRSAWILTGVAPNRGARTGLQDIEFAIQTEIPLVKQHLSDTLWAFKGEGAEAERYNRVVDQRYPLELRPSTANTIRHGFAMISRFFPGAREELAAIDEEIVFGALGPVRPGKAHCFEDQYICTGGQLYELMAGHDRYVADLRPLMEHSLRERGLALGICCHPYDLSSELVARELGVIVTDVDGGLLNPPLDVESDVAWIAYANERIREQVEPLLQQALAVRGLVSTA